MPIRGLWEFLIENRISKTIPLHEIVPHGGNTIGIDAVHWLKKAITQLQDPFFMVQGGMPETLQDIVERELVNFRNAGIRPVFVFNGLAVPRRREKLFASINTRIQKREEAWHQYYDGHPERAAFLFQQETEKSPSSSLLSALFSYLREKKVECLSAPYLAWAQLSWLAHPSHRIFNAVYGGVEVLLFGMVWVITEMNFEKNSVEIIDLRQVMGELNIAPEQFLDACIIAGFDYCVTFPPLQQDSRGGRFNFAAAAEMVKSHSTGMQLVLHYYSETGIESSNYVDQYTRARCLVRHHPVFSPNCVCEPLNSQTSPEDLHEIMGPRLPNDLYFFLCSGTISPQVINNLISGLLVELPPLVDSEEYRSMLNDLIEVRARGIGILSASLHEHFRNSVRVVAVRWFDPETPIELNHASQGALPDIQIFSDPEIEDELLRRRKINVDISLVLDIMSCRAASVLPEQSILFYYQSSPSGPPPQSVSSFKGVLTMVLLHGLVTMEYIHYNGHPTTIGAILNKSLHSPIGGLFPEQCLLALELLHAGYLSSSPLQPNPYDSDIPAPIRLISRVFSLLPMTTKSVPWGSQIDYDLMGFNAMVGALHRSLRNLLELIGLSLFLRHRATLNPSDWSDLSRIIPFSQQANTCLGVMVKFFLLHPPDSSASLPDFFAHHFPAVQSPSESLQHGLTFWKQVVQMTSALQACNIVTTACVEEFSEADQLLNERWDQYPQLRTLNSVN